jgi:hypothetical protein
MKKMLNAKFKNAHDFTTKIMLTRSFINLIFFNGIFMSQKLDYVSKLRSFHMSFFDSI